MPTSHPVGTLAKIKFPLSPSSVSAGTALPAMGASPEIGCCVQAAGGVRLPRKTLRTGGSQGGRGMEEREGSSGTDCLAWRGSWVGSHPTAPPALRQGPGLGAAAGSQLPVPHSSGVWAWGQETASGRYPQSSLQAPTGTWSFPLLCPCSQSSPPCRDFCSFPNTESCCS